MPEWPEGETMVRGLRGVIEGRRIVRARVSDPLILANVSRSRFERAVRGATVTRVWRRGKWVVLGLATGQSAVIQPRMTGGFRVGNGKPPAHSRIHFRI